MTAPSGETPLARARKLLGDTLNAPGMFAVTREGLIMRAATVCEVFVPDFPYRAFYERHLDRRNLSVPEMQGSFDDDWARAVLRDALAELPSEGPLTDAG